MKSKYRLTKNQKESVALLQIGTFLEYFDLMIYIHMAVLLNDLFFPKGDPQTESVRTALAFCSTYALRPFGALIFGYIGDRYGRKPTIIITTGFMACCCLVMANLPTYAEIGISAAIIVSVIRIIQGMSSMGEVMGARIYITEMIKPPMQYPYVASIGLAVGFGSMSALGIASIATRSGFNWRIVFWIGAVIAIIGFIARSRLRETPDFIDARRKIQNAIDKSRETDADNSGIVKAAIVETHNMFHSSFDWKAFLNFFAVFCGWPLSFYMTYMYFIPILKTSCGYSSQDIILHNLCISIVQLFASSIMVLSSRWIYPLHISKFLGWAFIITLLVSVFVVTNIEADNYMIFAIQAFIILFALRSSPSEPIMIKYFAIFRRFTSVTFAYALSRAVMYVAISLGLVYLTEWFGYYGILVISLPIVFFWMKAIYYYEDLEKANNCYPSIGKWQVK